MFIKPGPCLCCVCALAEYTNSLYPFFRDSFLRILKLNEKQKWSLFNSKVQDLACCRKHPYFFLQESLIYISTHSLPAVLHITKALLYLILFIYCALPLICQGTILLTAFSHAWLGLHLICFLTARFNSH